MAGFIRIRKCCCCGGNLKGATITIGVFYLFFSVLGSATTGSPLWRAGGNLSVYGICEEAIFLPMIRETSIVTGIVSLLLLYGTITAASSFIAPWLAWNIVFPIIQLAQVIWAIAVIVDCELTDLRNEFETTVIVIVVCNAVSLALVLYFAVIVYSHYKDVQEEEKRNISYGAKMLLPSKNWDQELSPYTSYNPSAATPMNWGTLPPAHPHKGPAPPPPPVQKPGIPRPQSVQNYSA